VIDAYTLIQPKAGKAANVAAALRDLAGVSERRAWPTLRRHRVGTGAGIDELAKLVSPGSRPSTA
jgi:hypothetical protein